MHSITLYTSMALTDMQGQWHVGRWTHGLGPQERLG